jgi:hypothetical protein
MENLKRFCKILKLSRKELNKVYCLLKVRAKKIKKYFYFFGSCGTIARILNNQKSLSFPGPKKVSSGFRPEVGNLSLIRKV